MLLIIFHFFTQSGSLKTFLLSRQYNLFKADLLKKSIFYQDPQSQGNTV